MVILIKNDIVHVFWAGADSILDFEFGLCQARPSDQVSVFARESHALFGPHWPWDRKVYYYVLSVYSQGNLMPLKKAIFKKNVAHSM